MRFLGILHDFFNGCITIEDTAQAVFTQCYHSELDRLLPEHDCRGTVVDQVTDRLADNEQLENAFSPFITSIIASRAAAPVIENLVAHVVRGKIKQGKLSFSWLERRPTFFTSRAQ